jgi:hypothetical protein
MLQEWSPADYLALPVRDGCNDIRLLRVRPSSLSDDILICDLRTISLDDNPKYVALSYVWGPPVFDHGVQCGDKAFEVTTNLHAASHAFQWAG